MRCDLVGVEILLDLGILVGKIGLGVVRVGAMCTRNVQIGIRGLSFVGIGPGATLLRNLSVRAH